MTQQPNQPTQPDQPDHIQTFHAIVIAESAKTRTLAKLSPLEQRALGLLP